jgi:3-phenylpropionate/cinnamic acid dioxygenase small subunit
MVDRIPSGIGAAASPVHDFDRLACLIYIESVEDGKVSARSNHLLFRIRFDGNDSASGR